MPRFTNKHGQVREIPFKPAHIALLMHQGYDVYPDEGISAQKFQEEERQIHEALDKIRNRLATRFAAVGEKGKEYVDTATGEVIPHNDPRRKKLDKVDRKNPGRIKHFEDGGYLPDPANRFQTDQSGAVVFDDKTDMGRANVSEALNNPQQTFISGGGSSVPSSGSAASPAQTVTPSIPESGQSVLPSGGRLQEDQSGSVVFNDTTAIGRANVGAAGLSSMRPAPLTRAVSPASNFTSSPLTTPLPLALPTGSISQPSPLRIAGIGDSLLTDKSGSIRFDDTSGIGRQNTAFALTPLSQRKPRI